MSPSFARSLLLTTAVLASGTRPCFSQAVARLARDVGIDQKLGARVSLDLPFADESGREVRLRDFFGERPVVLALVYYRCPLLCNQVLTGLVHTLRALSLEPGRDFEIVTVSIDPSETSELAAAKKASYVDEYGRAGAQEGWHFLVGGETSIDALADEIGFRYVYDEATGQFAHASGFVVLTPRGVASRYFYGIEHSAKDLRLALVESSEERIGSLVDRVLLLCYHYDPATGRYGFVIFGAIRALGLLTIAGLGAFLWRMLRRERKVAPIQEGG